MLCPACNQEVVDTAKFCRHCGVDFGQAVPLTNNEAPVRGEVCPGCAAPLGAADLFCKACGRPAGQAVSPAPLPEIAPAQGMPTPSPARGMRTDRSNKTLYIAISAVLVLLVCAGALVFWVMPQPQVPPALPDSAGQPPADSLAQNTYQAPQDNPPEAFSDQAGQFANDPPFASAEEVAAAQKKAEEAKRAKKAEEARRAKKAAAEQAAAEARAREAEKALPVPVTKKPDPNEWLIALRRQLRECEQESFFSRIVCADRARWKYCPGRWDTVAECTFKKEGDR